MDTSYLEKQVSTIINKLHELFDEIGVPSHERDSRESELFTALSETLHNQLRLVTNEKHELAEEAEKLITTIKQMSASLEGNSTNFDLEAQLKITYPLKPCLQALQEKHKAVAKLHRERYEQVKKLAQAVESYSSHLEPSFSKVPLPPTAPNATVSPSFDLSHAYFSALDGEFTRVFEEYERRLNTVSTLCAEIITLWAELGTPQAQTDSNLVKLSREAPEQLGLHAEDLARLKAKKDRLVEEKKAREKRIRDLAAQVEGLWERLAIPQDEKRAFLSRNRGCGMRTVNEFEDELARLNELKKQNLGLFVEEARIRLQALWDDLYFSEEEMLDFTPAFSDVYSDALLAAHETELARLEAVKEQRAPTLALVDKHKSLIKDRDDLAASSQDASRLMLRGQKGEKRDPTRLLREEKMRKRIAKELPKVEVELQKVLETWEEEYGRPFLVHGERYLDDMAASKAKAPQPRSKTPSFPTHTRNGSKTSAPPSRSGTLKGAPSTLRSKTPTTFNTLRGNPLASSTAAASNTAGRNTSPSRIPARVPLGNMPHGNNSPERKFRAAAHVNIDDGTKTVRSMAPPRMPPPKMKDLFVPPEHATPLTMSRNGDLDRSTSIVRQMPPEDVYDDAAYQRQQYSRSAYHTQPSLKSSYSSNESHQPSYSASTISMAPPPRHRLDGQAPPSYPGSRQISATSTISSATAQSNISGSENWETYDDGGSDADAADATEAYYAQLRAQASRTKRATPEGGWSEHPGKRVRAGAPPVQAHRGVMMQGDDGVIVEGSEGGWTDDGEF